MPGQSLEWGDNAISSLIGLDADGNVLTAVINAAVANARQNYPIMHSLIVSVQVSDGSE